jgi:hypothetical protein
MKTIVVVCAILALLAPAHVFAGDSSSRFALDREWKIQQAQQRELDARFKAAEADAAKAEAAFERKADVTKDR